MKKILSISFVCVGFILAIACYAGPLDDALKSVKIPQIGGSGSGPDEATTISGLKEALSIGSGNAVMSTSKLDGYFANQAIKILLPEKIQTVADVLKKVGYQKQVDAFVLTMNRAAENAAPKARQFFVDAIKEMSFQDAMKILKGNETAATEYFKSKTFDKIYAAFKPPVAESMDKVGVTKSYKDMMGTYTKSVPFVKTESLDLDHYVTTKSLDGLFYMLGEEEKKIRTNPAARVTDLLKKVFGK
jgi:hypothetical protein